MQTFAIILLESNAQAPHVGTRSSVIMWNRREWVQKSMNNNWLSVRRNLLIRRWKSFLTVLKLMSCATAHATYNPPVMIVKRNIDLKLDGVVMHHYYYCFYVFLEIWTSYKLLHLGKKSPCTICVISMMYDASDHAVCWGDAFHYISVRSDLRGKNEYWGKTEAISRDLNFILSIKKGGLKGLLTLMLFKTPKAFFIFGKHKLKYF